MSEPLTAEELDWLPSVRLASDHRRPADLDETRRLLDIIDRLDRAARALRAALATQSRGLDVALIALWRHSKRCAYERGEVGEHGCDCGLWAYRSAATQAPETEG